MACKRKGREFLYSPTLLLALIHRSAWNKNSANFAFWAFSEVRRYGVLRRLMCNELDQQVRQVTKWPAERSVGSLGAGIRCDLGPQARQQPA